MSRNREQFGIVPRNQIPRAKFPIFQKHSFTCNLGDIIPFFAYSDVLPGDTWSLHTNCVVRLQTPKYPTMDVIVADIYWFSQLWRNLWRHTNEFFGENTAGAWKQTTEYTIPKVEAPTGGWTAKDAADYMGIPPGIDKIKDTDGVTDIPLEVNALNFRMYANTCNEWMRNQNVIAPYIDYDTDLGDATISGNLGLNPTNRERALRGRGLLKASKLADLAVSCLPEPQKGDAITIPLGTTAPVEVYGNGKALGLADLDNMTGVIELFNTGSNITGANTPQSSYYASKTESDDLGSTFAVGVAGAQNTYMGVHTDPAKSGLIGTANLTNAVAATINVQRLAWALQRILEKDARGGTRYTEIISYQYGVHAEDETLQIPRYLGGERFPISITQVAQSSETSTTPLGETGAFSWTTNSQKGWTQSFTKHMCIMGLLVLRQATRTYQQGVEPQWWRTRRFDVYIPSLANLGEMAMPTKWIYLQGGNVPFGFYAPWEDYRFLWNRVSAEMRSSYAQSQDAWHYADEYNSAPVLSEEFVTETPDYVDRTLVVPSTTADQFKVDMCTYGTRTAPIPLFGVPGLVDHM